MVYVTAPVMSVCRKYLQKSGWYRERYFVPEIAAKQSQGFFYTIISNKKQERVIGYEKH